MTTTDRAKLWAEYDRQAGQESSVEWYEWFMKSLRNPNTCRPQSSPTSTTQPPDYQARVA